MDKRPYRHYITDAQAKKIIQMIASHEDIIVCTKTKDLARIKVKPARKGRVWGNGQDKEKKPTYPYRVAMEFLIGFKSVLNDFLIKKI
jgi:hypothetical protein